MFVSRVQKQASMYAHTHTHTHVFSLQCGVFLGDFPNLASSPRPERQSRVMVELLIHLLIMANQLWTD